MVGIPIFIDDMMKRYAGNTRKPPIAKSPTSISVARAETWSTAPAEWDGLALPDSPPDSALFVDHVDVSVFPLRKHPQLVREL